MSRIEFRFNRRQKKWVYDHSFYLAIAFDLAYSEVKCLKVYLTVLIRQATAAGDCFTILSDLSFGFTPTSASITLPMYSRTIVSFSGVVRIQS